MYDLETLTGERVLTERTRHGLSREAFSALAGFTGKSTARLNNIEKRDSWRPGDRERVRDALVKLSQGNHQATAPPSSPEVPGAPVAVLDVDPSVEDDEDDADVIEVVSIGDPVVGEPIEWGDVTSPEFVAPVEGAYEVSNSEVQTWKRCRRKWWLSWYLGFALKTESVTDVRAIGNRIHRALEQWYRPEGEPRVDPRDALERIIVEDWTRINATAREQNYGEDRLADLTIAFANANNLERAMVEGYVDWLAETGVDADLRVTGSEVALYADAEVDVSDPGSVIDDVRPVRFIGKIDTRVYRTTDGARLVLDHKTVGDLNAPAVTLPQNEQMLHYHLLEFLVAGDGEERCDGALYNMIKRVKRSARAKPPFYSRIEVHHNNHELASYRERLMGTTRDIIRTIDQLRSGASHRGVAYPTPKSECRWDCDFFTICNMLDDGSSGVGDIMNMLYHRVDPRARYDGAEQVTSE